MALFYELLNGGEIQIPFFVLGIILAAILAFWVAFVLLFRLLKIKTLSEFKARFHLEQFYEMLFMAPDAYFTWFYDYDGKAPRQVCSRRLAVLFGLKKGAEATFDDMVERLDDKDKPPFLQYVDKLLTAGENFATEVHLTDSEQRIIAIGCRAQNVGGLTLSDTIWFRDITKTSYAMDELYSENKYVEYKYDFVKAIVDALPFPLWSRDDNLNLNYCNKAYVEAVGLRDADEVIAKSVEIAGGESLRKLQSMAKTARAGKQLVTAKEHIVMGAKRRFVALSEQFLEGCDGEFKRSTVGMAIPIDEEDKLAAKLKAYIGAHDGVLSNLTTAIGIFGADTRLSFYNPQFLLLWGLDSDWLDRHPTYSSFLEALREKKMTPEVRNFSAFKAEEMDLFRTVSKPKDGLWHLPNQKILRRFMLPHPLGGLLFSYEDVTDRIALESSYRTLIEVQKATIDNIHEAVVLLDNSGRLKLYNAHYASLWDFDEAFLAGTPTLSDLVEKHKPFFTDNDEEWPGFKNEMVRFLSEDMDTQLTLNRLDGRILDVSATRVADGGILITFEDVTNEVHKAAMHEQSSKIMTRKNALRSRFISDLADNFKAPLDELYELSKKVPGAHVFAEKARDVGDMFTDLMSLAMAEAGSSSLDLRLVDLSEMMDDVLQNARQKAVLKSVEVESDFAKGIFVEADEERFRQMLSFAFSAMINLTYRGGVLGVSLKKQNKNDIAVVRINFNPHIVLHDMEAPGTVFFGAGSSLMLALVGMHGGQITFEKSGKFVSASLIFPLEN